MVIFFNLVRNVNIIMDVLARQMAAQANSATDHVGSSDESSEGTDDTKPPLVFKEKHRLLKLRLGPLRRIQTDLERRLGTSALEPVSASVSTAAPFGNSTGSDGGTLRRQSEFFIHSSNGWKTALDKVKTNIRPARTDPEAGTLRKMRSIDDDIAEVIAGCRDDMKAIWEDGTIREMLQRTKTKIEDSPGL